MVDDRPRFSDSSAEFEVPRTNLLKPLIAIDPEASFRALGKDSSNKEDQQRDGSGGKFLDQG